MSVQKALTHKFNKYLTYKADYVELLMAALQSLAREYTTFHLSRVRQGGVMDGPPRIPLRYGPHSGHPSHLYLGWSSSFQRDKFLCEPMRVSRFYAPTRWTCTITPPSEVHLGFGFVFHKDLAGASSLVVRKAGQRELDPTPTSFYLSRAVLAFYESCTC